jgi:hypothetical protein
MIEQILIRTDVAASATIVRGWRTARLRGRSLSALERRQNGSGEHDGVPAFILRQVVGAGGGDKKLAHHGAPWGRSSVSRGMGANQAFSGR